MPFHVSVGAVVVNDQNKVLAHHYPAGTAAASESYLLMRESIQMDETPLCAVKRGIAEEFGLQTRIKDFIGSIVCEFIHENGVKVEKTTLYFLCDQPQALSEGREQEGFESQSKLEWLEIEKLAKLSADQIKVISRTDFDESKILQRVAQIIRRKA